MSKRKLRKPDFDAWAKGGIVPGDPFSEDLKRTLWDCFPKKWTWEEKVDVLYSVGQGMHIAESFFEEIASADCRDQLQKVQEKARALLQALAELTPQAGQELNAHIAYLVLGSDAPNRVSEYTESARKKCKAVSFWWDVVQDVEIGAAFAAAQISPSKTDRPAKQNAKRLIYFAADAVYRVMGELPPRSKEAWFAVFVRELGCACQLTCGADLIESVVQKMDCDGTHPKRAAAPIPPVRRNSFISPEPPPD